MTIVSLLDVRVRADALDRAEAVLAETLTATRAFAGCLGVEVIRDVDDPGHYIAVERWESIEDDDAYRAWRATPGGASPLGAILESRVLTRYDVTAV